MPTSNALAIAVLANLAVISTAQHVVVQTDLAPAGPGGAAQGLVDGRGYLTTSIQHGIDARTGKLVAGGATAQMTQAMSNIAAVFAAAGRDLATSGASCWIYGFNASTFGDISAAYYTFFPAMHHYHPARNPTGATLILDGALVGVSCRGFSQGGVRVAPPNFFASDLNAQGLLVDGGAHLFTSAQLGANPISGNLVAGGAVNETRQALSNIAVVFAAAFPRLGRTALSRRASECQLIIVNDTASGVASVWQAVEREYARAFAGGPAPAMSITGFPVGALPIPAHVAVTCNGVGDRVSRTVLGGGVVARVGSTTQLQASAELGEDVNATFAATAAVFAEAFPYLAHELGTRAPSKGSLLPKESAVAILQATATECQLWLADPAADVAAALASLSSLFIEKAPRGLRPHLPPLTVTKAALPSTGGTSQLVALQCFGSDTKK